VTVVRRQQTQIAVLGGLSIAPMSAYALREAIRDTLGHFWSESFGQIYPTLADLEAEGLVERADGSRPGASLFSVTPAGLLRLRELLAEPITMLPPRNGLLLRLFFGRVLGVAACRELLVAARGQAQASLAEYHAIAARIRREDAGSPDLPFALVTLSAGRHSAEAAIAWADDALALLEGAGS
jgi:DNA-binding PadR family transcriptional regulator